MLRSSTVSDSDVEEACGSRGRICRKLEVLIVSVGRIVHVHTYVMRTVGLVAEQLVLIESRPGRPVGVSPNQEKVAQGECYVQVGLDMDSPVACESVDRSHASTRDSNAPGYCYLHPVDDDVEMEYGSVGPWPR